VFVSARSCAEHAPTLNQAPGASAGASLWPVRCGPYHDPFVQEEFATLTYAEEKPVTLGTILLVILVLMLIGAIPRWSHSRNWGYGPSGGLGLVLVVIIALLLMGRL
jgi:hypothetical protein